MNRAEFQTLAMERREDAKAFLQLARYGGAYYIAGYAIECGPKAVIARRTKQDDFPPQETPKYYVHNLTQLRDLAGLKPLFDQETASDRSFRDNWQMVKDWNEQARYHSWGQKEAEEIVAAITDDDHGVLQWLKRNW
jgi:hypothetical protein